MIVCLAAYLWVRVVMGTNSLGHEWSCTRAFLCASCLGYDLYCVQVRLWSVNNGVRFASRWQNQSGTHGTHTHPHAHAHIYIMYALYVVYVIGILVCAQNHRGGFSHSERFKLEPHNSLLYAFLDQPWIWPEVLSRPIFYSKCLLFICVCHVSRDQGNNMNSFKGFVKGC